MRAGPAIVTGTPIRSAARSGVTMRFARVALLACAMPVVCVAGYPNPAYGQQTPPESTPTPSPTPAEVAVRPAASTANVHLSSHEALFDISNRFLRRLGDQATSGATIWKPPNPGGGGASEAPDVQRYRAWLEGYGLRAITGPQNDFTGDQRRTFGGTAGLGVTVVPGLSLAFSADQSRTKIDVSGLLQNATLDMTQFGGQAAFEWGAWTLGVAAVHGTGDVDTTRGDAGISTASYGAKVWAVLGELSYLWQIGNTRIVPKAGADWTRTETDAFAETGGVLPISATGQTTERTRAFIATEFGYTWLVGRTVYDASVYVRVNEILQQDISAVQVTAASGPTAVRPIQGIKEAPFGFDAGATASMKLSSVARVYALYDGRLRNGYESHTGTIGLELKW
jgi:uncharacterized protein with beta-barrel porin domain